jgi:hypothetical protein
LIFYQFVACTTGTFLATHVLGQQAVNYGFFSKDAFGGIHVMPPTPFQIEPVNIHFLSANNSGFPQNAHGSSEMSQQILGFQPQSNVGMTSNNAQVIQQQANLEMEAMINEANKKALEKDESVRSYRDAFVHLSSMNPDHFSLSLAVYEVENAYLEKHRAFHPGITYR